MPLPHLRALSKSLFPAALLLALCGTARSQSETPNPLPHLVHQDGRYALFVNGAPYLMLGAQVNNSSAWPAMLPKVWPAIEYLHANTVEIPVYWEQLEPQPNQFDYSTVDLLLTQAREHHVHLVLLWFGTWKNGSSHYMPAWTKREPERYFLMKNAEGRTIDSPSPYSFASLEADKHAFTALMTHLKSADAQHTVLMVQVENETGSYGSVRDYSPAAQKAFNAAVPASLLQALHVHAATSSPTWREAFGVNADEYFHAWSVAHYVGEIAAAGKAAYHLPVYVNAALRDPITPGLPSHYEAGGPTDNVLPIWKAAAPAIDLIGPDIYMSESSRYFKVLDLYRRPDNALFVPETGSSAPYSRYFFAALGRGAIGFSPFGMDYTSYVSSPIGATRANEATLNLFALNYQLIAPMDREIARLNFEGKLQAVAEATGQPTDTLDFGNWKATVSYGLPSFGSGDHPRGNAEPTGRALIASLGPNEFLVTGLFCRVDFQNADPNKQRAFFRVEEGSYDNGTFKPIRLWNGDQTDWGLNFTSVPQVLRVTLSTY